MGEPEIPVPDLVAASTNGPEGISFHLGQRRHLRRERSTFAAPEPGLAEATRRGPRDASTALGLAASQGQLQKRGHTAGIRCAPGWPQIPSGRDLRDPP